MNSDRTIPIKDFLQLRMAARHMHEGVLVSEAEAIALYTSDARCIEPDFMTPEERELYERLMTPK